MGLDFWSVASGTRALLPWRHALTGGDAHRWLQQGTSRAYMEAGCPICRGYQAGDDTSLEARSPHVAGEWHPQLNGSHRPVEVTPGSRRTAVWLCKKCSHVWSARISSRALDANGCPRCAGQVALPGDAATLAVAQPELYAELDVPRVVELGLEPSTIHPRSRRRLPWKCRHDASHRWVTSPAARMSGCVCPHCPAPARSSATERRLLDLLHRRFPDAVGDAPAGDTRWADSRGRRISARCDVVVACQRLVVEYDGLRYHGGDRRRCDTDKTTALLADGWRVVRIRERAGSRSLSDLDLVDDGLLQVQHRYGNSLLPVVNGIAAWIAEPG